VKIVVFGANGRIGHLVVEGAIDAGHDVTAFVHHKSKLSGNTKLKIVQGDIHRRQDVARAVKGSGAVISALGSWGTKSKDIVSSGMANIIPAMQSGGVERIISLTGADARAQGDKPGIVNRLSHTLIKLGPPRKILADGEEHIRLLERSGLDWTVVRSPIMNERGDAMRFKLTGERPMPWATVNRRSVAAGMLRLIEDRKYSRQAPFISRE
jgi:putative NADH-flavin reductase